MADSVENISTTSRMGQVRIGVWIEVVSLLWMVVEASVAIGVGVTTRSVSLQGFGIDSVIELIAGSVLLWRLVIEQRGASLEAVEKAERCAAWVGALSLFALAFYIISDSVYSFLTKGHAQSSIGGIGLAIAAAIIMPILWQGKLRVARRIDSAALKADAICSVTCAYMSFALLVGLLLNALFSWWWADSLAALALVYFIMQEGREALHEARTGETCTCHED